MRVLWFTNTPLFPITRKFKTSGVVSGGWMDSLRLALQYFPDLELGAASISDFDYTSFEEGGVQFLNIKIPSQHGSMEAIYKRWLPSILDPNGLSNCLDIVEKFKPDIIHIHGSEGYFGNLAKETTIPTVISIQGILSICELFYFGGLNFKEKFIDTFSLGFLRGISTFHQFRNLKKSALRERKILKGCKYFIGRTEFDKNFLALVNPASLYYHCDEIIRSPFYSGKWMPEFSERPIIFCTSSGPAPYKGLDCLLDACQILKTHGFSNIQLRIAGPIQMSPIWHIIKTKIKELDIKDEVIWLGQSSSEQIVSELQKANAFVLPSYIENSPNSLAEAMLIGTPCIASAAGGIPSLVTHGKDGLMFQPGDAYSLAAMIAKVLRDPSLAKLLSENAKITATARHDPKKIAADMMTIYSEIIIDSQVQKHE